MKIMNKIMLMMVMMLSAVGIQAKTTSKKGPNKQQIHFYNKYGSDVVVQATWHQHDKPKLTQVTDFTVKKGKTMTVKAPISGYDLEKISAQNAGMVAAEVGMAVGSAIVIGATLGVASADIASMDAGVEAGEILSDVALDEAAAADTSIIIMAGFAAGGQAGLIKVYSGKAQAHKFTHFTFVANKKQNKKNPAVMIVCSTVAPGNQVQSAPAQSKNKQGIKKTKKA